ncbi:6313_t:CDS:2 [Paraglomus occultum]|uniref:6313_t:CDS:1 n=1 Tax=Paraglomus occultum TaxID=144539 RepID=A0A9N9CSA5_9GLOM|nr:6313_t:CDS:2 [Paraglomus occultum]
MGKEVRKRVIEAAEAVGEIERMRGANCQLQTKINNRSITIFYHSRFAPLPKLQHQQIRLGTPSLSSICWNVEDDVVESKLAEISSSIIQLAVSATTSRLAILFFEMRILEVRFTKLGGKDNEKFKAHIDTLEGERKCKTICELDVGEFRKRAIEAVRKAINTTRHCKMPLKKKKVTTFERKMT